MTTSFLPKVIVQQSLGQRPTICNMGEEHITVVYAEKILRITDEVRWQPVEGYSDTKGRWPVYRDAQGRLYDRYQTVDYYSNVYYIRRDDGERWNTRLSTLHPTVRFDKVKEMA